MTRHPTAEWAAQQIVECCGWDREPPRFLIHDRDSRYGALFDRRLQSLGITQIVSHPSLRPTAIDTLVKHFASVLGERGSLAYRPMRPPLVEVRDVLGQNLTQVTPVFVREPERAKGVFSAYLSAQGYERNFETCLQRRIEITPPLSMCSGIYIRHISTGFLSLLCASAFLLLAFLAPGELRADSRACRKSTVADFFGMARLHRSGHNGLTGGDNRI